MFIQNNKGITVCSKVASLRVPVQSPCFKAVFYDAYSVGVSMDKYET